LKWLPEVKFYWTGVVEFVIFEKRLFNFAALFEKFLFV
jgi:hypothetical protein